MGALPPSPRTIQEVDHMSRKDDWNRKVYDYTTLRTKYDIKERARAMAGYVGLSLTAYITRALMKQVRKDEEKYREELLKKLPK